MLAAALLAAGCGDDSEGGAAADPRWFAGDFHVHTSNGSNDTRYPDGTRQSFPETIKSVARERGMSFVVLTDHSNSTGSIVDSTVEDAARWNLGPEFPLWDVARDLSDADFLMIDGNEISPVSTLDPDICPGCPTTGTGTLSAVGHIGCLPIDLAGFDRSGGFVDRPPGQVTGGSAVEQCRQHGGFAVVNHPFYFPTPWLNYDWTSFGYDAIEVFNGSVGLTYFDTLAYDAYLCDHLAGRQTVALGGSDNHRAPLEYGAPISLSLGAPLGFPLTSVLAERLTWADLMTGIRAGRTVMHERGTFVEYLVGPTGEPATVRVGGTTAAGPAELRLRGSAPRPLPLRFFRVAPDGCVDHRVAGSDTAPDVTRNAVHESTVCSNGACEFDTSVSLTLTRGLYYATLGDVPPVSGLGSRDVAITATLTVTD